MKRRRLLFIPIVVGLLLGLICSCRKKESSQLVLPPALCDALAKLEELTTHHADFSSPETKQKVKRLESIIESEVQAHRKEIFQQQMGVLRSQGIDSRLVERIKVAHLLSTSKVNEDFSDGSGI